MADLDQTILGAVCFESALNAHDYMHIQCNLTTIATSLQQPGFCLFPRVAVIRRGSLYMKKLYST